MRIGIASLEFRSSRSGIGYYARLLVEGLLGSGHEVWLVVPDAEVPGGETDGLRVVPFACGRLNSHASWLAAAQGMARTMEATCRVSGCQIAYFTQARDALLFRPNALRGAVLGGVHDYYFAQTPRSPFALRGKYGDWLTRWTYYQLVRALERRVYRRLDGLLFNSVGTQRGVTAAYGLSGVAQMVCYYGIREMDEVPEVGGHREPVLLFVGGNFERKGLPTVLRALPVVVARHPCVRLVVMGDCSSRTRMEALAQRVGVASAVSFVGYQPNDIIQQWVRKAKLLVMPSLMEGFGIVFLEAMRAGTPVVASPVGGIPEVVRHGRNGLLVPPGQPSALAEACLRLLDDAELYERLASEARGAVSCFSVRSMIETTEVFFRHACRRA